MAKQKLELTWIGKENRPRLEPRILLEDAAKSYHASRRLSENDIFDNRLIFGDNLLALKVLEQEFAGKMEPAPAEGDNGKPARNTRQGRKARQRRQEPTLFEHG